MALLLENRVKQFRLDGLMTFTFTCKWGFFSWGLGVWLVYYQQVFCTCGEIVDVRIMKDQNGISKVWCSYKCLDNATYVFSLVWCYFFPLYQFFWTSFRDMVLCDFQRGSMLIPPKGKRMVSRQEHLTSASNKSDFSYPILSDCLFFSFN